MKQYIEIELEVIRFTSEDVIVTSCPNEVPFECPYEI